MSVTRLNEQATRGDKAKQLLDNELIKDAFDVIEKTILDAWRNSSADQKDERDNAYIMFRLLQNFKEQFKRAIITGNAAKKELLMIKDPSKIRRMINGR